MSGWRATFPTERLFGDPRFLRMTEPDQGLLFRLYARCDRWGRGPADAMVLPLHLMVIRQDVREQLDRVARSGLVKVYQVDDAWFYQITDYDDDCLKDTLRKRGSSNYPDPSSARQTDSAPTLPQGQTDSAPRADIGQTDSAPTLPQGQTEHTLSEAHSFTPAQNKGQARSALTLPQGQTDSAPRADLGQIDSVHARQQSRAEQSRAEQSGSTPRARPPAPAHTPARVQEPPDPRVVVALARWQRKLTLSVPHAAIDDDSVLTVARDFAADVFVEAVERHCEEDREFWTKTPLRFLRRRCEFVARDRERAPPPSTHEPRNRGRPKGEAYPPCDPDAVPEIIGPPRIAQGVTP